jgi:hypothetical protein
MQNDVTVDVRQMLTCQNYNVFCIVFTSLNIQLINTNKIYCMNNFSVNHTRSTTWALIMILGTSTGATHNNK